jgi:hypothetical protein
MSDDNRNISFAAVAALTALLIAFGLGIYVTGLHQNQPGRHQSFRYFNDLSVAIDGASSITDSPDFEYRTVCENPRSLDESNLCAQWSAAKAAEDNALWAKWSLFVGLFSTIGLFSTLFLTWRAVRESIKATEAMEEQSDIAIQSYVAATRPLFIFESIYVGQDLQGNWEYNFSFKNVGKGIAFVVEIEATRTTQSRDNLTGTIFSEPFELKYSSCLEGNKIQLPDNVCGLKPRLLHLSHIAEGTCKVSAIIRYQSVLTDKDGNRGPLYEIEVSADILPITPDGSILIAGRIAAKDIYALGAYAVRRAVKMT